METSNQSNGKKDLKQAYRTAYLIAGFLKGTLSQEEKEELDNWILASDENMILFEKMTDEKNVAEAAAWLKKMNVEEDLKKTKERIADKKRKNVWQYAVAAAIAILIGLGIYIYISAGRHKRNPELVIKTNDMMPGSDIARLQLENGTVIYLDSINKDSAINNQVKILQGEVIYSNNPTLNPMAYNTLTIPRKGHYKLALPDGTIVWLNAESSIRFPVAFAENERKVFVTGETFFQVAKDKSKPFRVVANDMTVEALGTQFNVNAYANEPFVATTLIEGSVLVSKGNFENILKPGQQAQLSNNDNHIVDAKTDEVIAWKNDQFKFRNTPIESIMRQIERWYDADVSYQDKISLHLNATISRNVPVSKLLQVFEETGEVHFKIEDKKIVVMK